MNDPFLLLGVSPEDDDESVRRAWLALVRRFPPERDPARFEAARAAYERIDTRRHRLAHALFDTEPPDLETLIALALRADEASRDAARTDGDGPRRPSPELLRRLLRESLATGEPAEERRPA